MILEAARRACGMLGLAGFYPGIVSWQSVTGTGRGARVVTPHFPVLEGSKLIISPILKGRVDGEDWGPILASSLVFYKRLKSRYNMRALFRFLPGLLLFAGFFVYGYAYMSRPDSSLIFGFIAGGLVLIVLGAYSIVRLGRTYVLEADKEAALVIGNARLNQAFQKLEYLREQDATRGNDWPEYGDHPSLPKRIAQLQST